MQVTWVVEKLACNSLCNSRLTSLPHGQHINPLRLPINTRLPRQYIPIIQPVYLWITMSDGRPQWGAFCATKGVEHIKMNVLVGHFCIFCGAKNPGADTGSVPHVTILDSPVASGSQSRQAVNGPFSQMQPSRSVDDASVLTDASYRAHAKVQASLNRMNSIHSRPSAQQRLATKTERSRSIVLKIPFDVSLYRLVWYGHELRETISMSGKCSVIVSVIVLTSLGVETSVQVPSTATFADLHEFVDRYLIGEVVVGGRLSDAMDLPRSYATKAVPNPILFPKSAYNSTSLADLVATVPWKEGTTKKFIICFNDRRPEERWDEVEATPTPTPRKAKPRSVAGSSARRSPVKKKSTRKFDPSGALPFGVMIKKEKADTPKGKGHTVQVVDDEVSAGDGVPEDDDDFMNSLDLGLSPLPSAESPVLRLPPSAINPSTPSRKRSVSQVEDPQLTRTTPQQASEASHTSEHNVDQGEGNAMGAARITRARGRR